jgi:hypothetical protein
MDFVKPPRWSKAEADQRLLVALRLQIENWLMTEMGQNRKLAHLNGMSVLTPTADVIGRPRQVRVVPEAEVARFIRSPRRRVQAAWEEYSIQSFGPS